MADPRLAEGEYASGAVPAPKETPFDLPFRPRLRRTRIRAALTANPLLVDASIAFGLTCLTLISLAVGVPDLGPPGAANVTLVLLQTVPLVARRRFPVAALLTIAGALAVQLLILPEGTALGSVVGLLLALFTVGERLERRVSITLTVIVAAVIALLMFRFTGFVNGLQAVIQTMFFFGAAWYVGDASRIRRLYTQALEEQTQLARSEQDEHRRQAIRRAGADCQRAPRRGDSSCERHRDPGRRGSASNPSAPTRRACRA